MRCFLLNPRPKYSVYLWVVPLEKFKKIMHDSFVLLAHLISRAMSNHISLFRHISYRVSTAVRLEYTFSALWQAFITSVTDNFM